MNRQEMRAALLALDRLRTLDDFRRFYAEHKTAYPRPTTFSSSDPPEQKADNIRRSNVTTLIGQVALTFPELREHIWSWMVDFEGPEALPPTSAEPHEIPDLLRRVRADVGIVPAEVRRVLSQGGFEITDSGSGPYGWHIGVPLDDRELDRLVSVVRHHPDSALSPYFDAGVLSMHAWAHGPHLKSPSGRYYWTKSEVAEWATKGRNLSSQTDEYSEHQDSVMTNIEKLGRLRVQFQVQFPTQDRVLVFLDGLPEFAIQPPRSCFGEFMTKQRKLKDSDPEKDDHGISQGNLFGAGNDIESAAGSLLVELRRVFRESETFLATYNLEFAALREIFGAK